MILSLMLLIPMPANAYPIAGAVAATVDQDMKSLDRFETELAIGPDVEADKLAVQEKIPENVGKSRPYLNESTAQSHTARGEAWLLYQVANDDYIQAGVIARRFVNTAQRLKLPGLIDNFVSGSSTYLSGPWTERADRAAKVQAHIAIRVEALKRIVLEQNVATISSSGELKPTVGESDYMVVSQAPLPLDPFAGMPSPGVLGAISAASH